MTKCYPINNCSECRNRSGLTLQQVCLLIKQMKENADYVLHKYPKIPKRCPLDTIKKVVTGKYVEETMIKKKKKRG